MGNTIEKVKSSIKMSKDEKLDGGKKDKDEEESENDDSDEEESENEDSDEDVGKRGKFKKKKDSRHICDEPHSFEEKDMAKRGFKLGKEIGRGSFAVVKSASYKGSDDVLVAKIIKTTRKDILFPPIFMIRETDVISKIRHRYIIKVYKIYIYPEKIFLFTQNIPRGSLFDFLNKYGRLPNESYGRHLFQQMLEGMNYLHDLNIAHRDLKLENVLLDYDDTIRIIDYGFSIPISYGTENYLSETFCGSPQYAPPEVLDHKPYDVFMADVWSLGVVIFSSIVGRLPFPQTNDLKVKKAQELGKFSYPECFKASSEFKNLNKCMMDIDSSKRWSMKALLTHKWVLKEDSEEDFY